MTSNPEVVRVCYFSKRLHCRFKKRQVQPLKATLWGLESISFSVHATCNDMQHCTAFGFKVEIVSQHVSTQIPMASIEQNGNPIDAVFGSFFQCSPLWKAESRCFARFVSQGWARWAYQISYQLSTNINDISYQIYQSSDLCTALVTADSRVKAGSMASGLAKASRTCHGFLVLADDLMCQRVMMCPVSKSQ